MLSTAVLYGAAISTNVLGGHARPWAVAEADTEDRAAGRNAVWDAFDTSRLIYFHLRVQKYFSIPFTGGGDRPHRPLPLWIRHWSSWAQLAAEPAALARWTRRNCVHAVRRSSVAA